MNKISFLDQNLEKYWDSQYFNKYKPKCQQSSNNLLQFLVLILSITLVIQDLYIFPGLRYEN